MKRLRITTLVAFVLIFQIMICSPLYAADELSPGTTLPKFTLKTPEDPVHTQYLGIQGGKTFTLPDISAKLIVLEFFSVSCPKCHSLAPKINQIYKLIEGNPEMKQEVKMLAVALLAKPNQLDAFKKKYDIAFPLFADEDGEIMSALNISTIPQTLILDKSGKVLSSHKGMFDSADGFLAEIRKLLKEQ